MIDAPDRPVRDRPRPGLRLRTLVQLRWLAIAGQTATVLVAIFGLGLAVPLAGCAAAIATSVAVNLASLRFWPASQRLSARGAVLVLMFDIAQLAVLLWLTGGLNNPFALLILAPVTVAATALPSRAAVFLGAATLGLVTLVAIWHVPLRLPSGMALEMPPILTAGMWLALFVGVLFLAGYARQVSAEAQAMQEAYLATQMALAREQNLTNLGGVVAAAAHELGTPLATIRLVTSELLDDVPADNQGLREDLELIGTQADRCRDILRDMGKAGKDDLLIKRAPLSAVAREAAEPHAGRGIALLYDVAPSADDDAAEPTVPRRPEIIHGLRNLIQNAVDFSKAAVRIDIRWSRETISLRVTDDGPGYPPDLIGRIGEPYLRHRAASARQGYDGMGLGLFIAKTLLERSGAQVTFFNEENDRTRRGGAVAAVTWPRAVLDAVGGRAALGRNRQFPAEPHASDGDTPR
jgi:two-component system sensor histidine kinase RegB